MKVQNTICLAMIVKNESKVIERCLESVRPLLSHWVICDTGSTDDTRNIIKKYFKKCKIKGELYEDGWQNFGHNRSLCMKRAKGKAQYIITLDADEVFKFDEDFKMPKLNLDQYYITTRNGSIEYTRVQLVSDKFDWYYEGVLHEYIHANGPKTIGLLKGIYNHPSPEGARSSDPNKYKKDALTFERAILDEPDNARYVFYLAQSYRDSGDLDNAIKNYQKRTKLGGYAEEIFRSHYEIGMLKMLKKEPFENFVGDFLLAYSYRPGRLETMHKIVKHCRLNKMALLGWQMGKHIAEKETLETNDMLFVEKKVYDYQMFDELSMVAYWAGDYQASRNLSLRILKQQKYPAHEKSRLMKNLVFANDKLGIVESLIQIFTTIYDTNKWGYSGQPHKLSSGIGNTKTQLQEFQNILQGYFKENNIKFVADLGCGIWEFEREEFNNVLYIGIDCVKNIIDFNKEKYLDKNKSRKFIEADVLNDKYQLPNADMYIIKDTLQHLSNQNIIKLLKKVEDRGIKYILIVNNSNQIKEALNIKDGEFRPLDSNKYPLNQFKPRILDTYNDKQILLIGKEKDNFKIVKNIEMNVEKIPSKGPKVSIIIGVFNDQENILCSINSVINQSYNNWELIIIDDHSSDNTVQEIKKFINDFNQKEKIVFIQNDQNVGFYASVNKGIQKSTGEFISMLGSDDHYHKDKIKKQLEFLAENNEYIGVYNYFSRDSALNIFGESTMLYRKNIIDKVGYYDSVRCAADSEFLHRIKKVFGQNKIHVIKDILYYAKTRENSLTTNKDTFITSELRKNYVNNFSKWHRSTDKLYMPFPLIERPFDVNSIMKSIEYDKKGKIEINRPNNTYFEVISLQDFGHPGLSRKVNLKKNTNYKIVIEGYAENNSVKLYLNQIERPSIMLAKELSKLELDYNSKEQEILELELLFEDSGAGDKFYLKYMDIYEINDKSDKSLWITNQNVKLIHEKNIMRCICRQNTSTPGIKRYFNVIPENDYQINIKGFKKGKSKVYLWIATEELERIEFSERYELKDEISDINYLFKNYWYSRIHIGFLFKDPHINDEFIIEELEFTRV